MTSTTIRRILVVSALAAAMVWEGVALFAPHARVRAQVRQPQLFDNFGAGAPVGQTFRMASDGLNAIELEFSSRTAVSFPVRCRLLVWNPYASGGDRWVATYEWVTPLDLPAGRTRRRFEFTPVVPSRGTVYQFQVQQFVTSAGHPAAVAVVGSLDDVLKDGNVIDAGEQKVDQDLAFQAFATGDRWFSEFRRRINSQVPRPLRHAVVQALLLAIYNGALALFVYRMILVNPEQDARGPRDVRRS